MFYNIFLDIRYFFKFLYKKFKCIFSKKVVTIYVCPTGNDKNSGFNSLKPKLTIASALALVADCPLINKKNPVRIMLVSDSKRESITIPGKKERIKL